MGQIADESHRIGQGSRVRQTIGLAQVDLPGGGVQSRKQLVSRIAFGFDQCIEQCGLARIGVTDQGHAKSILAHSLFALCLPLAHDFFKPLAGSFDPLTQHAPVEFDLGLSWAAPITNATALSLQVGPTSHQPG